jgi:predicted glycosyltransferase
VLSNSITYPFASQVIVPECYQAWLPPWHLKYPGYHELSYLHPKRFTPDREKAVAAGLDPGRPTFLLRTVSWGASHDVAERGWTAELLREAVRYLCSLGTVLISSECELPEDIRMHRFKGPVSDIHHVMAFCRLYVGESATMASECAVLGIPAVYAASTGRGYTDEEERTYGLVKNVRELSWPSLRRAIDEMLAQPAEAFEHRRMGLLSDKIDVAAFVADLVMGYPRSVFHYKRHFAHI